MPTTKVLAYITVTCESSNVCGVIPYRRHFFTLNLLLQLLKFRIEMRLSFSEFYSSAEKEPCQASFFQRYTKIFVDNYEMLRIQSQTL